MLIQTAGQRSNWIVHTFSTCVANTKQKRCQLHVRTSTCTCTCSCIRFGSNCISIIILLIDMNSGSVKDIVVDWSVLVHFECVKLQQLSGSEASLNTDPNCVTFYCWTIKALVLLSCWVGYLVVDSKTTPTFFANVLLRIDKRYPVSASQQESF